MNNYRLEDFRNKLRANNLLYPLDVALVGATGVGKSSTINALFGSEVAVVGTGVDPETQNVAEYKVNNVFRIHDSAGLGDGISDERHKINLSQLLLKTCTARGENDSPSYGYIDLALVILDASTRDLGTTYMLLEHVVLQCIQPDRVIVAINQADMAMKGRNWNATLNRPNSVLCDFLEEKAISVQKRIRESTGLSIKKPVYYSAYHHYNIDKLMDHIINHIPTSRRTIEL